jgi:putative ABC transport system ATP-binding protein
VRVDAITVGYGRSEPVLRDVSVSVPPGQLLAVTGPSGAGKTTLLWAMAGLVRPTVGRVELDGEPLRDRDDAVARQVVLVPQDNGLAAILTAGENLEVALIAGGRTPAEARRLTAESLDRLGLAGQTDQLVEELSGGQQQRTAIARGLALVGDVLLADEVTSELDAGNRQRVLELLRAEADRGAAVVFATHDPEAAAACDAELHLLDGRAELVRAELVRGGPPPVLSSVDTIRQVAPRQGRGE